MESFGLKYLVPLLSQVFLALVVAIATVRLALGRFREEKWWERKYEAYSEILLLLHKMKQSYFADVERDRQEVELSEEEKAQDVAEYRANYN
jgi:hypothetical protein